MALDDRAQQIKSIPVDDDIPDDDSDDAVEGSGRPDADSLIPDNG